MSLITPLKYVGFDTITLQIELRLVRRGFTFNVMVVGHSGLGKTTLVNLLFAAPLVTLSGRKNTFDPVERTCEVLVSTHQLEENGVRLNVNVIDTPGFGDQINNERCWEPIVKYIKEQHLQYLRRELTAQRERFIPDTRVHAVLYFLQTLPAGGIKALDVVALRKLCDIANVIPVIPKADALTPEERARAKKQISEELKANGFRMYPYDGEEYGEEERQVNHNIQSLLPFAVVASDREVEVNGRQVRGRATRWGAIDIEDVTMLDFVLLRDFLTRTHLQDLIETTAGVHYELFRAKQLIALRENAKA